MSWFKPKPKDAIPNPRDKKRRQYYFESAQRNVLHTLQFFVFALAVLLLLAVSQ